MNLPNCARSGIYCTRCNRARELQARDFILLFEYDPDVIIHHRDYACTDNTGDFFDSHHTSHRSLTGCHCGVHDTKNSFFRWCCRLPPPMEITIKSQQMATIQTQGQEYCHFNELDSTSTEPYRITQLIIQNLLLVLLVS